MANSFLLSDRNYHSGDQVRVHLKVLEGEKERVQIFEGLIIAIRGRGENRTFTVRKIGTGGIGVERVFPVNSPWISQIEVKKPGDVRRAKLYYVRDQSAHRVGKIHREEKSS